MNIFLPRFWDNITLKAWLISKTLAQGKNQAEAGF
jgi:hypothetical protein